MPKRQRVVAKKKASRPSTASRTRRKFRTASARSGLGSILVNGFRTILASLPASRITTPVADFVFRALGFTSSPVDIDPANGNFRVTAQNQIGVKGGFSLKPKAFMATARGVTVDGPVTDGNPNTVNVISSFHEYRFVSVKIVAKPTSATGSYVGNWALGFYPYIKEDDATNLAFALNNYFPYSSVIRAPVRSVGALKDTLTVRYYFRLSDGFAYQFHDVDTAFGMVLVAYENYSREKVSENIPVTEFGCTMECSAKIICKQGYISSNAAKFNTHIDSPLSKHHLVCTATGTVVAYDDHRIEDGVLEGCCSTLTTVGDPMEQ
jgi:hypothetical protein